MAAMENLSRDRGVIPGLWNSTAIARSILRQSSYLLHSLTKLLHQHCHRAQPPLGRNGVVALGIFQAFCRCRVYIAQSGAGQKTRNCRHRAQNGRNAFCNVQVGGVLSACGVVSLGGRQKKSIFFLPARRLHRIEIPDLKVSLHFRQSRVENRREHPADFIAI